MATSKVEFCLSWRKRGYSLQNSANYFGYNFKQPRSMFPITCIMEHSQVCEEILVFIIHCVVVS